MKRLFDFIRKCMPSPFQHSVRIRFSEQEFAELQKASDAARAPIHNLLRAGASNVVREIAEAAEPVFLDFGPNRSIIPPLKLSKATRERMSQLDHCLGLPDGEGVAETFLKGILAQLVEGDFDPILTGWQFEDEAATTADLQFLVERWKASDTLQGIRKRHKDRKEEAAA